MFGDNISGSSELTTEHQIGQRRVETLRWRAPLLMVAVISASIAVRPPITVIGPLAETVHTSTGLSSTAIGVLTTLPLVVFMLVSAHVSRVARRLGMEVAMAVGFAFVLGGSVIRWVPSIPLMYLGTAVVAIGLTMPNVLLPGIIRRDFQARIGSMTSLYIALTAGGSGVASFLALPFAIDLGWGWRATIASTGVLAAFAAITWSLVGGKRHEPAAEILTQTVVWRSRTAWWVALFFSSQTLIFYCVVAWLVPVLITKGLTPTASGAFLGGFSIVGIGSSLLAPNLAARQPSQSTVAAAFGVIQVVGAVGMLVSTGLAAGVFALVLGVGAAGGFAVAFALFGLRAPNHIVSSELAGMAQTVGYGVAAIGPLLFGFLHDLFGNWNVLLGAFVLLAVFAVALGVLAGRPLFVSASPPLGIHLDEMHVS
ncbi:hypothetical protein R4282_03780 [Rhodococcus oxybenzonivorans]|uniref:MFS transporter n=1 Tax=Rhodococcus oxybenzonivorans TaxID=1990687 RepID=UPI002952983A|nr:MFS transporter [Rhodococcus oxybenzonivorans]MDV7352140.1 hypothetical protein [Rhodococcus oxybenzonivorans]